MDFRIIDSLLWSAILLAFIPALVMAFQTGYERITILLLGIATTFSWLYLSSPYLFWLLPLQLPVFILALHPAGESFPAEGGGNQPVKAHSRISWLSGRTVLFLLPFLGLAWWTLLCLPELVSVLRLKPTDIPRRTETIEAVLNDISLHFEAVVALAGMLLLSVAAFVIRKTGGETQS